MKVSAIDNKSMDGGKVTVIVAEEGKVFRRISDQQLFGKEICLGYTYYLNGEKLDVPFLELPEHFEEIDDISL